MNIGKQIYKLIKDIGSVGSTKEKERLLAETRKDEMLEPYLKSVLHSAFSPRLNFGVSYVPPKSEEHNAGILDLGDSTVWTLLTDLNSRKLTGNAARYAISVMMKALDEDSASVFRLIINRDLRAGFGTAITNKVWKGLIEETPYQRCSLPKSSNIDKWNWADGIFVQLKADGMFQSSTRLEDDVTIMSRSGEVVPTESTGFDDLRSLLKEIQPANTRIEGELIMVGLNRDVLDRASGNGILNSMRQGGEAEPGTRIQYVVWDLVDLSEGGLIDSTPYNVRFERLSQALKATDQDMVKLVPNNVVTRKEDAFDIYRKYVSLDKEGAVLKNPNAIWKDGTSKDQVKLKIEVSVDVEITGFVPGKKGTKTEKTFGALEYKSLDGKLVGSFSGLSDALRKEIHENREDWVGAICSVKANDITQNRGDVTKYALSHPRFEERRTDKTEADSLSRVKEIFESARESF